MQIAKYATSIILKVVAIAFFICSAFLIRAGIQLDALSGEERLFVYVFGVGLTILAAYLIRKAKRLRQTKGDEVLQQDKRAPILYLRPFQDDSIASKTENDSILLKFLSLGVPQNLSTEEEQISFSVRNYGPFIAIGDPHEAIPRLGASRIYADDAKWKDVVTDLIINSQLIILRADGETSGFWWEVKTVLEHKEPEKIIFLLPDTLEKYDAFKTKFKNEFSIPLPEDYEPIEITGQSFSALLVFNSSWDPTVLYCEERVHLPVYNGLTVDLKKMIGQILTKNNTPYFSQFATSRSKFRRTGLAEIQRFGAIIIISLIVSGIIAVILEEVRGTEIEAGSTPMLTIWAIVAATIYFLNRQNQIMRKSQSSKKRT